MELRGRDGGTALHMAARTNPAAFLALLALGADDTAIDDEGLTPWDYAKDNRALHGLPEVQRLKRAEQAPSDGPTCDGWGTSSFFRSASPERVRECLDDGADPDVPDADGRTPMDLARENPLLQPWARVRTSTPLDIR